ncbi:MAG: TetR/AcrR family transcriptional regulator [Actinomycetota bacterium]
MAQKPNLSRERRLQILEAAAVVISERGLCDTRIADVAERAGASAALIIYYFESKGRLLTEALAHAEDRFYLDTFHELTALESATDQLIALIEMACPDPDREAALLGDWTLWIELWSRAMRDPEAGKRRAALDRRWRWTIADIVRSGQRSAEFAPVDADDFAVSLVGIMDGLALQVVLRDEEVSWERTRDLCLDFAARELGFERGSDRRRMQGTSA